MSTVNVNHISLPNNTRLRLPNYSTAQRDALIAQAGDIIYNTTDNNINYYTGVEWKAARIG